MEESTPQQAASRYRKIIDGYKAQLRNHPELKLSEYCRSSHANYSGVIDWTKRHGISVLELRREARGEVPGKSACHSDPVGTFIQFMPSSKASDSEGEGSRRGRAQGCNQGTRQQRGQTQGLLRGGDEGGGCLSRRH